MSSDRMSDHMSSDRVSSDPSLSSRSHRLEQRVARFTTAMSTYSAFTSAPLPTGVERTSIAAIQRRCTTLQQELSGIPAVTSPADGQPLAVRAARARRDAHRTASVAQNALKQRLPVRINVNPEVAGVAGVMRDATRVPGGHAALSALVAEAHGRLAAAKQLCAEQKAIASALVSTSRQVANPVESGVGVVGMRGSVEEWRRAHRERRAALDQTFAALLETLGAFCNMAYPPKTVRRPRMRGDTAPVDVDDPSQVVERASLSDTLKDLMNLWLTQRGWMSSRHVWGPYLELLLRARIVEQNPDNRIEIRLRDV